MESTEIGSVAAVMAPKTRPTSHGEAQSPVCGKAGNQGRCEHADCRQEQNRRSVLPELPNLELDAAFKQQRGKKDNQRDAGRQPVRLVADQSIDDWQMDRAQDEASNHQGNRVGDSQTGRDHGNHGSRDQQP